jgi:hypothetical protein
MATLNYKSITAAVVAAADKKPGHSDVVLISPTSEFTTIAIPTAPFVNPGDSKKITADHTFPTNAGWKKIQCKANSIDPTGDAAGEAGGQVAKYKYKIIIKGDSPHINEFVENLLNEDIIALFNDPVCGVDNYVQLGSACTPANLSGWAFRGGNKTAGGFKEYEFTIESSDKFFYEGTVTMAVEDPILASVGILNVTAIASTSIALDWESTLNTDEYEIHFGISPIFTGHATETSATSNVTLTGLTPEEIIYIRVRAVGEGYANGPWSQIAVTTASA